MTTSEKVAYLKGLAEGLELDTTSKEGKILSVIMDILEDVALDLEDMENNAADLGEVVNQISDDLADVENLVYDEDDDEDDWDEDEDEDTDEEDDEDGEEPVFYEVTCPACGNTITIDEDVLDLGGIECPNCGEHLEFDGIEESDEDDGDDGDTDPEKE